GERQMFPAACDECWRETMASFQPGGNTPAYCSDCFANRRQQPSHSRYQPQPGSQQSDQRGRFAGPASRSCAGLRRVTAWPESASHRRTDPRNAPE
ncbi:MAG TPA: hypothetical protein DEG70_11535, partial [Chloroflexi bacterium]|nr:hypothetical protein [Chloroflexota bacterium]